MWAFADSSGTRGVSVDAVLLKPPELMLQNGDYVISFLALGSLIGD